MKIQKILLPTDDSPLAETVLGHGLFHAEVHDAELHLIHCVKHGDSSPTPQDPDAILDKVEESARVQIEEKLEQHKEKPIKILERTVFGESVARCILNYIEQNEIDLTIMGAQARHGLKSFLLGSVTEEVVRLATCPVLTVRADHENMPVKPIRRILVPIDFSDESKNALRFAADQARLHHAQLWMIHILHNTFCPVGPEPGLQSFNEVLPELRQSRQAILDTIVAETGIADLDFETDVRVGTPYQEIVDHAAQNEANLIVMGTHGYSGLAHLLLGSTAERVMRMATCPVCTLKARPPEENVT